MHSILWIRRCRISTVICIIFIGGNPKTNYPIRFVNSNNTRKHKYLKKNKIFVRWSWRSMWKCKNLFDFICTIQTSCKTLTFNLFQLCYVVIKKNRLDIDISNLKISFQKFSWVSLGVPFLRIILNSFGGQQFEQYFEWKFTKQKRNIKRILCQSYFTEWRMNNCKCYYDNVKSWW